MKKNNVERKFSGLSGAAILSFLCSLTLCSFLTVATIVNKLNVEKMYVNQLMLEKSFRINLIISKLLYKTNTLASIVLQGNGSTDDFDLAAPVIADSPAILNVLLAPDGVVTNVYPIEGNENLIGLDFFSEGAGNNEAAAARDSGQLVLGGPFKSVQGSEIMTGRLPVFIDTPNEKNKFWGLVSVTLKFPQVLQDAELDILKNSGFSYELWRINPDTNQRQVILSDYKHAPTNTHFVEKHISIYNADWYLKVWPIQSWYSYPQNLMFIIAGFLVSFLVLFVMQNNHELRQIKSTLEDMARSDPLTGIYNRRHFMDISQMNLERARRLNRDDCYIVLFDLDKFKMVNDKYGHIAGDKILVETTSRITANIRPYDLFARFGGEEFIIYACEIGRDCVFELVERLRLCICGKAFEYEGAILCVSASFGIARIENYDIKKAISHADKALYAAKRSGRNKTVFWEEVKK
jgi:diguanylate cyclase (GGDEF)-like protein